MGNWRIIIEIRDGERGVDGRERGKEVGGEIETERSKSRVVRRGDGVGGEIARRVRSEGVGGASFGKGGGAVRGRDGGATGRGIDAIGGESDGGGGGSRKVEKCGRSGTL